MNYVAIWLILALLWALFLIPQLVKSRVERASGDSIGAFQRQLSVLQRSAPSAGAPPVAVPLRPTGSAGGPTTGYRPGPVRPSQGGAAMSRSEARRRRKAVFVGLLAAAGATLVLGLVPALRPLLWVHLLVDVALLAYVALLLHVRTAGGGAGGEGALPAHGTRAGAAPRRCCCAAPPTSASSVPPPRHRSRRRARRPRPAPYVTLLDGANQARERGLAASRQVIRSCGTAIRAVHRLDPERAARHRAEAEEHLRRAQEALAPYPAVAHAGFLHDAAKEYAEACLTAAMVADGPLPGPAEVGVEPVAWLGGLAEAASELRRHLLDRLREGDLTRAEALLAAMDDAYDLLVSFEYPDALVAGFAPARRTPCGPCWSAAGADVTTAAVQARLQAVISAGTGGGAAATPPPPP